MITFIGEDVNNFRDERFRSFGTRFYQFQQLGRLHAHRFDGDVNQPEDSSLDVGTSLNVDFGQSNNNNNT